MLATAFQQSGQFLHTPLALPQRLDRCASTHRYSLSPPYSDRAYGILDQEQHRRIASPSQTDPPSVFI